VVDAGIGVAVVGSPAYPRALVGDIEPPAVIFHRGTPDAISGPRVAVVGTRRCSPTGAGVAFELGRDLAAAGVAVVSGLASGIDGAAHRGALAAGGAPPLGVVGTGLDVVYPPGQTRLWRAVAAAGVLLSEAPLGALPERWRFPARNRIIAALADLVVVVESHRRGGSLHTVDEADRRGRDVMAVPGSVRSAASEGTNALLAEGRAPVCSIDDVLVALGLAGRSGTGAASPRDRRATPHGADQPVLEAVGWQPSTLDQLLARTGMSLAALAPALDRLCDAGWVARRGGWYERIAVRAHPVSVR
jgi:DNA processing protein